MAKTLVGALRVTLGLDSAEFAAGAAKAQSISAKLSKQLMGIGAAVSVVGVGIAAGVRRQLNAADDLGKLAQKIGMPIEELSALAWAAEQNGISLGALSTGLRGLSKNVAGNEDRFKKLGVAVRDAQGKIRPTTAIVDELAEVFAKMPDGAEKTALAMELFGKSGAEMLPMLNAGKDGIQTLTDEARKLGLVVTEDTAKAAADFNDNLNTLSATGTGLFRIISAQLAPVLVKLTEYLVDLAKWFQNLSPEMQRFIGVAAGIAVVLGPALMGLSLMLPALALLFSPLGLVAAGIAAIVAAAVLAPDALDRVSEALTGMPLEEQKDAWRKFGDDLEVIMDNLPLAMQIIFNRLVEWIRPEIEAFGQVILDGAQQAYDWFTAKMDELVDWLAGLPARMVEIGANIVQGLADGIRSKWESVKSAIRGANTDMMRTFKEDWMIQSPSKVTEGYGRNIAEGLAKGIAAGQDIVGQAVSSLNDTAKGAMKGIGDLGNQIGNMFATAATNVLTGVQSLREAVGQLLQQLAQLLINSAMKQLFGNIFGGLNLGLPGSASGTRSAARGLAMVGEEGPELVNFRGGERVYNARDTSRMARSGEGQGGRPASASAVVYLDGEVILSKLDSAEGEAKVSTVLKRLGY